MDWRKRLEVWPRAGICALALSLVGCAGGPAPVARPRLLILRSATGPVYAEFLKSHRAERYTGRQDPAQYRFIVVDGSSMSPNEVGSEPLIAEALSKGVSIMMVNCTEDHKRSLMASKKVPAHTKGPSAAYLVTPVRGPGRMFHLTDLRASKVAKRQVAHSYTERGFVQGQHKRWEDEQTISGAHLQSFMGMVDDRLATQGRATLPTPPSDYSSSNWFQVAVTESWEAMNESCMDGQSLQHQITFTFAVYADSGDTLQSHWFQWCAMSMQGSVNMLSGLANNGDDTVGYAQTLFEAGVQPINDGGGNGLELALVQAQPTSATGAYNSSIDFTIGYRGSSGASNWLWQQSLTQSPQSFTNWQATSPPPPTSEINAVAFQAMQTDPYNGDDSNWTDGFHNIFGGKHVDSPNPTSSGSMGVVGQAVWKTFDIFDGPIQIEYGSSSLMTQLHVKNHFVYSDLYLDTCSFGGGSVVTLDFSQATPPSGGQ